jgi:tetratricopeptide (TPR) repeat protein
LVDGRPAPVDRRALAAGHVLATGVGRACLTIDPAIDVCLAEHSEIRLESLAASSIRVRVETGLALASLSRRNPGSSFSLLAGNLSATAHGTTFAARHERGQAEVIVVEGSVEVARGGASSEQVGAHSRLLLRSGENVFERSQLGPVEEERLLGLRATQGSAFGVLELDSKAPLSRPPAVASSGSVEKPSPAVLLDAARAEVARGNARAALALYERLRALYPASAEGHTVLPTIGKLQLDLGDSARALHSFDAYLQRPGMLAPEALSGRIRALRALGQRQAERDAIQQYLARYPKGLERPLFEKRLRELDSQ